MRGMSNGFPQPGGGYQPPGGPMGNQPPFTPPVPPQQVYGPSPPGFPHLPPGGQPPYRGPGVMPGAAHPGRRLVARLIDIAILVLLGALLSAVATAVFSQGDADGDSTMPDAAVAALVLSIFGGIWAYEAVQLAVWGRTIGKRVMGLRVSVAGAPGSRLSAVRAMGRAFCYPMFFSFLGAAIPLVGPLNLLWMLWDKPLRQCLHDKMAGTVVIDHRRFAAGV
ncbi:RDD family protein [Actinomadura sp. NPDC047616]|uniref:RDD family protein n=1 Tax=Actinomadura sp. NPDC047616 TaxID=3155914 RepID=UPI0033C5C210